MSKSHNINVKNHSLCELNEMLNRQRGILKNQKVLSSLKDRGEGIKRLRDRIEQEIESRKNMENLERCMNQLELKDHNNQATEEKCVKYMLSKEQPVDLGALPFMLRTKTYPTRTTPTDLNIKLNYLPLAESLEAETKSYYSKMEQKVRQSFGNLIESEDESSTEDGCEEEQ